MTEERNVFLAKYDAWLRDNGTEKLREQTKMMRLLDEFHKRFPPDRLGKLTIEEYAMGLENSRENFCYWVEQKLDDLGTIIARSLTAPQKFGIVFSKSKARYDYLPRWSRSSPEEAFTNIRSALTRLVEDDLNGNLKGVSGNLMNPLFKMKICYLYNPGNELPINSDKDLYVLLAAIGIPYSAGENRIFMRKRLFDYYRSLGRDDMTPWLFMAFVYSWGGYRSALRSPDATSLHAPVGRKEAKGMSMVDMKPRNDQARHGLVWGDTTETMERKRLAGKKGQEVVEAWLRNHKAQLDILGDIVCECDDNDFAHYDISYVTMAGRQIFIEVKATGIDQGDFVKFQMSLAEHRFMMDHLDSYFVYFVNNVFHATEIKRISGRDVVVSPIEYGASMSGGDFEKVKN